MLAPDGAKESNGARVLSRSFLRPSGAGEFTRPVFHGLRVAGLSAIAAPPVATPPGPAGAAERVCAACGYDRAGLAAGVVCPECGKQPEAR